MFRWSTIHWKRPKVGFYEMIVEVLLTPMPSYEASLCSTQLLARVASR